MSYERLNLKDGNVWKAEHVNHLEDGIVELANSLGTNIENDEGSYSIRQVNDPGYSYVDTGNTLVNEDAATGESNDKGMTMPVDANKKPLLGAFGDFSSVFGGNSQALGKRAHAEGSSTIAFGSYSHAEGNGTYSKGVNSHAEGGSTTATGNCSHTEGWSTTAIGDYSHAEGAETEAQNTYAHAEGLASKAKNIAAHAEGHLSEANGMYSHAEGEETNASGASSHAEGYKTKATKNCAHAEGAETEASGLNSHAEGYLTKTEGEASHAEGYKTRTGVMKTAVNVQSVSNYGHSGGYQTTAMYGNGALAHGYSTKQYTPTRTYRTNMMLGPDWKNDPALVAWGHGACALGYDTIAAGQASFAAGQESAALGIGAIAMGRNNIALCADTVALGKDTQVGMIVTNITTNTYTHDEVNKTISFTLGSTSKLLDMDKNLSAVVRLTDSTATYEPVLIENLTVLDQQDTTLILQYVDGTDLNGLNNLANYNKKKIYILNSLGAELGCWTSAGVYSMSSGWGTVAGPNGCQNSRGAYNTIDYMGKYLDIIGNGDSENARSNAMTVSWTGEIETASNVASGGADYAEYFEWLDSNPHAEDRIGYIVVLEGEKIRYATSEDDDILGIISGTAGVIGDNAAWEWKQKYQTDDFGRVIWDKVEKFVEIPDVQFVETEDENGNTIMTTETIMTKEYVGIIPQRRLNPDYNPNQTYISRADRPEWDIVGLMGKLYVRDDGTCIVGEYAKVGHPGIATHSSEKTNMRVMKRINENIILVFMK